VFNTEYAYAVMVEMSVTDHIHICSDGKNEMDGLCMCTWSAAGSNTFAGVLEVIELACRSDHHSSAK
jgi:hypothetical protein